MREQVSNHEVPQRVVPMVFVEIYRVYVDGLPEADKEIVTAGGGYAWTRKEVPDNLDADDELGRMIYEINLQASKRLLARAGLENPTADQVLAHVIGRFEAAAKSIRSPKNPQ